MVPPWSEDISLLGWKGDPGEIVAASEPDPLVFLRRIAASVPAWHADAACRGETRDLFFPQRGESTKPALAICARCAARDQCLADALAQPERLDIGIRGGMTAKARRAARRKS